MRDAAFSDSGLLRIAGLPIRYWLAAANAEMFDRIRRLDREEGARNAEARLLAERIGSVLIPDPALTREDRRFLLAVRRSLHRGETIAGIGGSSFLDIPVSSVDAGDLIRALVAISDRDRTLATLSSGIEADLKGEQERLFFLPEDIYRDSPTARSFLPGHDRSGPVRNQKQRRHRFEYEWHRIVRAATGSTPRDWLSHVALLPIGPSTLMPPSVREQFTAQWTSNVRTRRLELADPPADWPVNESRLAMNPLHWDADNNLVIAMVTSGELAHVSVKHTTLLDAICENLKDAVLTFGDLADALGCVREDDRLALRVFVRHLVSLGILQTSEPPIVRLERLAIPGVTFAGPVEAEGSRTAWVDVYRYVDGGVSGNIARDVQEGALLAWRLMRHMRADTAVLNERAAPTVERTWMFTDILRDTLDTYATAMEDGSHANAVEEDSSAPASAAFTSFLGELGDRFGSGSGIVIDASALDEWGISPGEPNWPFDCLVRVPSEGADFTAVLDQLLAPGLLDSRFADTLADIHGDLPHVEAYRDFLSCLEEVTGVLFVELLTPPLSDGAANAVRRPMYTPAWTGDPLNEIYLCPGKGPERYIPLHAIRIRRTGGVLRADVHGQPIWPVHHATRSFSPPWDGIARVLLATAPAVLPGGFPRMRDTLTRVFDKPTTPRISLSGGIVLSPARWLIPADQLWHDDVPGTTKIRTLIRLRDRYSLPRWVNLVSGGDETHVPCDLESMIAIRTIERHMRNRTQLHLIEMLPSPDQLLVVDRAHRKEDRLASQMQLRFPHDESPRALAHRIAPDIIAALDGADLPQRAVMTSSNCRGPPAVSITLIEIGMHPFAEESRHVTRTETCLQAQGRHCADLFIAGRAYPGNASVG